MANMVPKCNANMSNWSGRMQIVAAMLDEAAKEPIKGVYAYIWRFC
jgi:pyrimidine oxygenase